jgi:uncharacterized protein (TIGR02246 family)
MITTDSPAGTEVLDVIQGTVAAWSANDPDAFADLYATDATIVLNGGTFLRGREEIRAFMTAGFQGPLRGTRGVDEPLSVRTIGDTAVVVSRSGFLQPGEDTLAPDRVRMATWMLIRQDGRWLVAAYHNSTV